MPYRTPRLRALALLCPLALAACGGGGGAETGPSAEILGVYSGNIQETGSSTNYPTLGIIAADGYTFFFSTDGLFVGSTGASGNAVGGSVTIYPYVGATSFSYTGSSVGNVGISGTAVQGVSLNGNFTSSGAVAGSFALNYDPITSALEASRTIISGTWRNSDSGSGYSMNISIRSSDGRLTGTDSDGCSYAGTVGTPETGVNVYRLNGSITCPGVAVQAVTGAVVRSVDTTTDPDTQALFLAVSNATMAAVVILGR